MRTIKLLAVALMTMALGAAAPATTIPIYHVMRHLDTPADGGRDPDLTAGGTARAQALATWFRGKPLTAIFVSDFKRTRQTVAPLAAERGLTVELYNPADTPGLIARLKTHAGAVLVVGHSNTVPDIVQQLGGTRPADLTHDDFGDIWSISDGQTAHDRLP